MPAQQTLIDYPVRKTRSSTKNSKENCSARKTRSTSRIKKIDDILAETEKLASFKSPPRTPKRERPVKNTANVDNCSPPKQKKTESICTPEKSPRKLVVKKLFTPVELFKPDLSPYQKAKQALHTSTPSALIGREKEFDFIEKFLRDHVENKKAGSLYISGAPGTGKTACVTRIIEAMQYQQKFKSAVINCMTVHQTHLIHKKIMEEFQTSGKSNQNVSSKMENFITSPGPMLVLILDEIDFLDCKNQEALYNIFEWSRLPKSRLILVGIANALDLTDRVLPRLQAFGARPVLLNFSPYSHSQILSILEERLKESKDIIKPNAMVLCARKIAACTGDVRKALEVCRRAVELAEQKSRQCVLKVTSDDGFNPGSPRKSPRKAASNPVNVVDVPQILSILNQIYGSRILGSSLSGQSCSSNLPLQQKLLICTLVLMMKNSKLREVLLGKLHDKYMAVCKQRQVVGVEYTEFVGLCTCLESQGMITLKKTKDARMTKVSLRIDEKEVEHCLQDKTLLSSILNDNK